jgi:hypothetical protein
VDEDRYARESKGILYLLVVDENRYARESKGILYLLVVDENRYARGPKGILYLLVVNENGYAADVFLVLSVRNVRCVLSHVLLSRNAWAMSEMYSVEQILLHRNTN